MKYLPNQNNMKPVFAAISLFILALVVSCGPAKNDSAQTPQTPVLPPTQQQNSSAEAEKSATEMPEVAGQESSTEAENNSQVTINPPHGQPGHRCDIPVGAPLNAQPANTARQTPVNPSVTAPTTTNNPMAPTIENAQKLNSSQPRNTSSAQNSGRINPPHGQPGHRCDIPVGSPLP